MTVMINTDPENIGGEFGCTGRISNSCSTCNTRYAT